MTCPRCGCVSDCEALASELARVTAERDEWKARAVPLADDLITARADLARARGALEQIAAIRLHNGTCPECGAPEIARAALAGKGEG